MAEEYRRVRMFDADLAASLPVVVSIMLMLLRENHPIHRLENLLEQEQTRRLHN